MFAAAVIAISIVWFLVGTILYRFVFRNGTFFKPPSGNDVLDKRVVIYFLKISVLSGPGFVVFLILTAILLYFLLAIFASIYDL